MKRTLAVVAAVIGTWGLAAVLPVPELQAAHRPTPERVARLVRQSGDPGQYAIVGCERRGPRRFECVAFNVDGSCVWAMTVRVKSNGRLTWLAEDGSCTL